MEKKTIGKFISALRRANGMTQKELGEKLYVSDKTVSRWERDECTPELSLLPAIAEIFDISTDELLRGERNSQTGEPVQSKKARSDKQFKTMLHSRLVRFRNMGVIALGVALAAVILAFVINASFYKGTLAFGIGAVLIVAALVCQFCFASSSLLRLDEDDDTYETEIRRANSKIITATAGILIAILALFAFLLPMGILGGSYYALGTISALALGFGCSLVMVIMCHVVYVLCIRSILTARGILYEDERAIQKAAARRRLLVRTLRIGGTIMLALFAVLMANQMLGPEIYGRQKDTFTDMTEFKEFMEKGAIKAWQHETLKGYGPEAIPGYECIFLDYGNDGMTDEVLLPPDFEVAQLTDGNGTVLCEYTSDPRFVQEVSWSTDTLTGEVQITTKTLQDMEKAESIHLAVRSSVLLLMVVTVIGFSGVYAVKLLRRKT